MNPDEIIVDARDLTKTYGAPPHAVAALQRVSVRIARGEFVALRGPSGSGKSTLMNLLGCLDRPTSGVYRLGGCDVGALSRTAQAWVRLHFLGFVFQAFHLLPHASSLENVALPLFYAGVGRRERERRAATLLERVGLAGRAFHRPAELSGGERQRVAIARALAMNPRVLLADEPTGALDSRTGEEVLGLIQDLRRRSALTVIVVTHDPNVGKVADREIHLKDGRLDAPEESGAEPSH